MSSPYRTPAENEETSASPARIAEAWPDVDLLPVLVPFWLLSVTRAGLFVVRDEPLQIEATLAAVAVVVLPLLMKDSLRFLFHP